MTSGASTQTIDPAFTALPYRRLADAALHRARDFGVTHADFRFERVRCQQLGVRDGHLQGAERRRGPRLRRARDPRRRLGLRLRGRAHPRGGGAGRRDGGRGRPGGRRDDRGPVELADEPVYDDVTWVSATTSTRSRCRSPTRSRCSRTGPTGCSRRRRRPRDRACSSRSLENKFYADLAGTTTTQQRVRVQPEVEAYGADEATGGFDSMRTLAPPVGRGWEYLTGDALRLGRRARPAARAARREAGGAVGRGRAATTWSSTRPTCG